MSEQVPSLPEDGVITGPDRNPANETLSILGRPVAAGSLNALQDYIKANKYDPSRHNLALIVMEAMTKLGINRFQDKLLDLGNEQEAVSNSQTLNASFQEAFALLEENGVFDSHSGKVAFPNDFFQKNGKTFNAMLKGFYQLFFNETSSDSSSETPTYASIKIYLPKPDGGYRIIQPYFTNNVSEVTKNPGDFKIVQNLIKSVNNYVFQKMGPSAPQIPELPPPSKATTEHMPIVQFMTLAMLQVTVDDSDTDFVDKTGNFLPQYQKQFDDGTLFTNLFGDPETHTGLAALQGIATSLSDEYKPFGKSMLAEIAVDGMNGDINYSAYIDPLSDMLADYLNQKSSGAGQERIPDGFNDFGHGKGHFDDLTVFSDSQNSFSQAGTLLQSMTQVVASKTQSYTAMITNFNQITQSITAGVNQATKGMTRNQETR